MSRLSVNFAESDLRRGRANPVAQFVQTFVLAVTVAALGFLATYYIGAHF
jgi:hypothetical protein